MWGSVEEEEEEGLGNGMNARNDDYLLAFLFA